MNFGGFETPLDAVLSGQYELCVAPRDCEFDSFIRNASFKQEDGEWSRIVTFSVTHDEATSIKQHKCIVPGRKSALHHYYTRKWPVNPNA